MRRYKKVTPAMHPGEVDDAPTYLPLGLARRSPQSARRRQLRYKTGACVITATTCAGRAATEVALRDRLARQPNPRRAEFVTTAGSGGLAAVSCLTVAACSCPRHKRISAQSGHHRRIENNLHRKCAGGTVHHGAAAVLQAVVAARFRVQGGCAGGPPHTGFPIEFAHQRRTVRRRAVRSDEN